MRNSSGEEQRGCFFVFLLIAEDNTFRHSVRFLCMCLVIQSSFPDISVIVVLIQYSVPESSLSSSGDGEEKLTWEYFSKGADPVAARNMRPVYNRFLKLIEQVPEEDRLLSYYFSHISFRPSAARLPAKNSIPLPTWFILLWRPELRRRRRDEH